MHKDTVKNHLKYIGIMTNMTLSHNSRCNIAITNFLVAHACEIRFHDVIDCTVHVYIMTSSYAKILKHGQMSMFWTLVF